MEFPLVNYAKLGTVGTTTSCTITAKTESEISFSIGVVGDNLSISPDDMLRLFKHANLRTEPLESFIKKYIKK